MNGFLFRFFSRLYKSARRYGSSKVLNIALGLKHTSVCPLSIGHGVDFLSYHEPIDSISVEPFYWAYNSALKRRSDLIKPSFLFPHPWILVLDGHVRTNGKTSKHVQGSDTLVIGPPSSKKNFELLYSNLCDRGMRHYDILLKKNILSSSIIEDGLLETFWGKKGIHSFSSSLHSEDYYFELKAILSSYDRVIAPCFSSLVVFARAMGKEVLPLLDYSYYYYEGHPFRHPEWDRQESDFYVKSFLTSGSGSYQVRASRSILGSDLSIDFERSRQDYISILGETKHYLYLDPRCPHSHSSDLLLRVGLAMATGRDGILKRSFSSYFKLRPSLVRAVRVFKNDWTFYASGAQAGLEITEVPFVLGVTEPGSGAEFASEGAAADQDSRC